jgi:hypothetical protein
MRHLSVRSFLLTLFKVFVFYDTVLAAANTDQNFIFAVGQ